MSSTWPAQAGSHAVQFYEHEAFLERAIGRFFTEAAQRGGPMIMIARTCLFNSVIRRLQSGIAGDTCDLSKRVLFVDAEATMAQLIVDGQLHREQLDRAFMNLLAEADRMSREGMLWIYGELVDLLCRQGHRDAAIAVEERWNQLSAARRPTVTVCAYGMESFDDELGAAPLRAVCRQHSHVFPTESISEAEDERARLERVALLEQRVRAMDRKRASRPKPGSHEGAASVLPPIYVIDDDPSVRRSLGRLIASANATAHVFDSAEAFLSQVERLPAGCLILDVQLLGMSGLDLQRRLAETGNSWPIVAMSGAFDTQVEQDALRLGAIAFLRKPFVARALFDAITRSREGALLTRRGCATRSREEASRTRREGIASAFPQQLDDVRAGGATDGQPCADEARDDRQADGE